MPTDETGERQTQLRHRMRTCYTREYSRDGCFFLMVNQFLAD